MNKEGLARRAIACKGWRWLPGMRLWCPTRGYGRILALTRSTSGILIEWERGHHRKTWTLKQAKSQLLPDLSDPCTLGGLLAWVRVVWAQPGISTGLYNPEMNQWTVYDQNGDPLLQPPEGDAPLFLTEVAALVAALEAAP